MRYRTSALALPDNALHLTQGGTDLSRFIAIVAPAAGELKRHDDVAATERRDDAHGYVSAACEAARRARPG
jgi:hypothetical protein